MKRILITGAHSYIGMSFEKCIKQYGKGYSADTIDVKDNNWEKMNFSGYDVILHVAAIVHQKEKPDMEKLYMQVNCDLTAKIAKKAKSEGISQFIFLSTMNVYGVTSGMISEDTQTKPETFYGKSKLKAEQELLKLKSDKFKIAVLRPPMVYGSGCKGNYTRLVRLAERISFFPDYMNQRSMINIDNLCAFLKKVIDEESSGLFFPQNPEYICTTDMVCDIAKSLGKNMHRVKVFNPLIKLLIPHVTLINKVFGNLVYERKISGSI